ncbi:hypothetical protein EVC12_015 [Rhizobium phage RHph_I42]|nr:hypothetical protein EVC12_015 [Rhizobium phage RHph_I42]
MRLLPDVLPWTKVFTEEHLCSDGAWRQATQPFSDFYEGVVKDFSENIGTVERITISRVRHGRAVWEWLGFSNPIIKTTAVVWHNKVGVFPDADGIFRLSRSQSFDLGAETIRTVEETGRLPGLRKQRAVGVIMENLDTGSAQSGYAPNL